MNARCPQCQTVFRVDPEKVPIGGVRARCARCNAVFALSRSGVAAAHRPEAESPVAAAAPGASPVTPVPAPPATLSGSALPGQVVIPPAPQVVAEVATAPVTAIPAPSAVTPPARPAATPAPSSRPAGGAPKRASFAKLDPNVRAQRLARALVSDIVAYNKEKREGALSSGNLKTEFREEIRKSWEEYVAQVGLDLARSTPFFRDSLNEILAKGQPLF